MGKHNDFVVVILLLWVPVDECDGCRVVVSEWPVLHKLSQVGYANVDVLSQVSRIADSLASSSS